MSRKKLVNLKWKDRYAKCTAKINKPAVRKLYWTFEPDGGNTALTRLGSMNRAGFFGCLQKMVLTTDKSGKCEHAHFRLSCAGLDKFKVKVSLKPDGSGAKVTDEFEVWRRIHISIKYMKPEFVPDLGPVKAEYEKHGTIVMRTAPAGAERVPHVEKSSTASCNAHRWKVSKPNLEARVLFVDKIRSDQRAETVVVTGAVNVKVKSGQLGLKTPWFLWEDDPEFARATVTGKGIGVYDITQYLVREGDRVFRTEIPDAAPMASVLEEALKRGQLTFKFDVRYAKYPNGFAYEKDAFIVIAHRNRGSQARGVAGKQGTIVHEMGHGFGLVRPKFQEYDATTGAPKGSRTVNSTYYDRGSGGHCSTGASGTKPDYENGSCVMFHAGHDARPQAFCPVCAKTVKAANLDPSQMPWPGV